MPTIQANGITVNYLLEGPGTTSTSAGGHDLVILINGLADSLETWAYQIPALHAAGYRTLRYDNRGIGKTSAPRGPYSAALLAEDLHSLIVGLSEEAFFPTPTNGSTEAGGGGTGEQKKRKFHLLGVSMGGMIAQSYALTYPNSSPAAGNTEMLSLALCCTYAEPTGFCSRMFDLWADMAVKMSVQDVMRDVLLWAFTVPFFRSGKRAEELRAVEKDMEGLEMGTEAYLSQLEVIRRFDSTSSLDSLTAAEKVLGGFDQGRRVLVLAGKMDILIPVVLSRELAEKIEGAQWVTVKGGHACLVSLILLFLLCLLLVGYPCLAIACLSTDIWTGLWGEFYSTRLMMFRSGSSPMTSTRLSLSSWMSGKSINEKINLFNDFIPVYPLC